MTGSLLHSEGRPLSPPEGLGRSRPSHRNPRTRRPLGSFSAWALLMAALLNVQSLGAESGLHVMAGTYFAGSDSQLLENGERFSHVTLGLTLVDGRKWAVMIDTTLFAADKQAEGPGQPGSFSLFYRANPAVANQDRTTHSLSGFFPSVVRLWRRDRFAMYFGGGLGYERRRQSARFQETGRLDGVDADGAEFRALVESGDVLVANGYYRFEAFASRSSSIVRPAAFVHAGVLVGIWKRLGLRAGYSWIVSDINSPPSQSVAAGLGLHF